MTYLIPDLENIISEYCDVHDYGKLIKLRPKLYSWKKYFNGELPDIYDAINVYDNLDLIEFLGVKDINYQEIGFLSLETAKYVLQKQKPIFKEYTYIIHVSLYFKDIQLFEFLIELKIYPLSRNDYFGFLKATMHTKDLEMYKYIHTKVMQCTESEYWKKHITSDEFIGYMNWFAGEKINNYFEII